MLLEAFDEFLKLLLTAVKNHYGDALVSLVVFGSVGRGTPRPDSDIDLLLVADRLPRGRMKRINDFASVEEFLAGHLHRLSRTGINTSLSPIIKTVEEVLQGSPLFWDMVDDARILYDRDGFFARYLASLRQRLEDLGACRIRRGNAWHWVLKRDYSVGEVFRL